MRSLNERCGHPRKCYEARRRFARHCKGDSKTFGMTRALSAPIMPKQSLKPLLDLAPPDERVTDAVPAVFDMAGVAAHEAGVGAHRDQHVVPARAVLQV